MVSSRRVSPFLAWVVLSLSENKLGSTVVIAFLNCNDPVLLCEISNVSRNGVEVVDFMLGILRLADSH